MRELLALPGWNTPPTSLEAWTERLSGRVVRDGDEVWLEVASRHLRGYVVIEDDRVSAINFELSEHDPDETIALLQRAVADLGWELHADHDEDDDDEPNL